jgi:hypothetical protein
MTGGTDTKSDTLLVLKNAQKYFSSYEHQFFVYFLSTYRVDKW